jgi:TorA maturation chaperone TorD
VNVDLARQAEERAALAAICGLLLLAEPGPHLAEHLAGVGSLASLAEATTAVEYERVFLRSVPPYESVFVSDDARRGGAASARVADTYDEIGFTEHRDGRWRVAGPDHLGLELRAHAHLASLEAAAWRDDRPDEAGLAVENERRFFAEHLGRWGQTCLDELARLATGGPYAAVIEAVGEFLAREIATLRPMPLVDGAVLDVPETPTRLGPGRLTRHLLAPARCGFWLSADDISRAARVLGFPWRPMDGRGHLRQLVGAASDAGELDALVEPWIEAGERALGRQESRALAEPGAQWWWIGAAARTRGTLEMLRAIRSGGLSEVHDREVVVRVAGSEPERAVGILRAAGLDADLVDVGPGDELTPDTQGGMIDNEQGGT